VRGTLHCRRRKEGRKEGENTVCRIVVDHHNLKKEKMEGRKEVWCLSSTRLVFTAMPLNFRTDCIFCNAMPLKKEGRKGG
jgi:hypothetical protein